MHYQQGNRDWENMHPLLGKVTYIGMLTTLGGILVSEGAKSRLAQVALGCSLVASSVAWVGSLVKIAQLGLHTGFQEVTKSRLNRLIKKIQAIKTQISLLEDCPQNAEELMQLKEALANLGETCTEWDGRVISDIRLPLGSYIRVRLPQNLL